MGRLFIILLLFLLMSTDVIVAQSIIINPDGTHSTVVGNIIVNSDGTHSTVHGNIIANSDGTHSTIHGNMIVNPNGTHTIINSSVFEKPFDKKPFDDEEEQTSSFPKDSRTYSNRHHLIIRKNFFQPDKNELPYRTLVIDTPVSTAFDRTMDYLQSIDYFLLSLDKQAGFIQAKVYIDNKKLFSAMQGERRTLNFIIRPVGDEQSIITLTVYSEEQYFDGGNMNRTYYYEDKGICKDRAVYEEILEELQKYLLSDE